MPQRGARTAVLKERLIQIVGVFGEIRLPYMVIGAFALAAWGRPRATLDLDFMIQTADSRETRETANLILCPAARIGK